MISQPTDLVASLKYENRALVKLVEMLTENGKFPSEQIEYLKYQAAQHTAGTPRKKKKHTPKHNKGAVKLIHLDDMRRRKYEKKNN